MAKRRGLSGRAPAMSISSIILVLVSLLSTGCTIPYWIKYNYLMSESEASCVNRLILSRPGAYKMNFGLGVEDQYDELYNGEELRATFKTRGQHLSFHVNWSHLSRDLNHHISVHPNMTSFYKFYFEKMQQKFKDCSLNIDEIKCQKRLPPNIILDDCSDG
jgi:hypothetical protein